MNISEVKAALGKPVHFRNDRLFCDSDYILTGCIIRRGDKGIYYQAELQDKKQQNAICIARLEDVTRTSESQPPLTNQQVHNQYDMLQGCCNRMFVTDGPTELDRMFSAAMRYLDDIRQYNTARLTEERNHDV